MRASFSRLGRRSSLTISRISRSRKGRIGRSLFYLVPRGRGKEVFLPGTHGSRRRRIGRSLLPHARNNQTSLHVVAGHYLYLEARSSRTTIQTCGLVGSQPTEKSDRLLFNDSISTPKIRIFSFRMVSKHGMVLHSSLKDNIRPGSIE